MHVLITGGCGFIGSNTALRLANLGHSVTILDNLSRVGSESNLEWLKRQCSFNFLQVDVRDRAQIEEIIHYGGFDAVIHLAGQVAVTSSIRDPRSDFEINAQGMLNILEAIRQFSPHTILLNASTNKVYGELRNVSIVESSTRYQLADMPSGISEQYPLDFYSPYGCSKGTADQYVLDYARIYGLRTVNFRQSCIYGYRQFGVEDQGWVAWFIIAHLLGKTVTIYGNGKQVRDVLFIDDLIECYLKAIERIEHVRGMTFNIGGGPQNTLSLLELLDMVSNISGRRVDYTFSDWRPGDQRVYISDIRAAAAYLDWQPQVDVAEGIRRLYGWVSDNLDLFTAYYQEG